MVEQLAPHGHGAVGDVQAGDTPGGEGVPDDVFRQEGEPQPPLDHLAQQRGAAQFQVGLDGQLMRFQYLIEGVAVAHAPLSEQKLLPGQLLQRDDVLCRQRVPGGGHEADGFRDIQRPHDAGLHQRLVQRIGEVHLVGAQPLHHLVRRGRVEHQLHLRTKRVVSL